MKIEEVKSTAKTQRISAHSHVKGLGLDENGIAISMAAGLVGQKEAREAAGIVVDLIKSKKMAGRAILLAGPPGTGKTAIALAIAQELGNKVPFCPMVGSEVYSTEIKKTEVLMENFRRAIGLRIKETKEVYEGEVTELTPVETENPVGGYGKTVSHVIIGLKTAKGTKQLKLDPSIYESLQKEKVETGDVIYIEANSGAVKRQGRSDTYATEFDLEAEEYVPLPKDFGVRATLRYSAQLLTPASLTAKVNGRVTIAREDVQEVSSLFLDAKSSAKILSLNEDKYMK
uniref:RuvB-like helicase n=1 Tax=Timema bartmani TaxID=61472 RepID=A0A7R9I6T9_9NEOP|nr:unnamed protein product [Timema bartmani]